MNTYNVEYTIGNSGDPIIEQIKTNSEENAKKIIISKYPNEVVHVWRVTRID